MAWLLYLHTLLEVHLCGMKEQAVERTRSEKKIMFGNQVTYWSVWYMKSD